jgi:deoxyribodipyrimidine photolyase-related protein
LGFANAWTDEKASNSVLNKSITLLGGVKFYQADSLKVSLVEKPYVSTARYIHAMSDYSDDCTYARDRRYGKRACPFNSLYWHFFHRNRRRLKKIPRIGMMYRTWDRMGKQEQDRILQQADTYRNRLDRL